MKPPYYMVYAPVGGFGNHIRWLLLLDKSYQLELDGELLCEPRDKVKFLTTTVYAPERTYNNWLEYEFNWRLKLDDWMKFTHDMTDLFDDIKSVVVTIDPETAYRCYVKFNPILHNRTKDEFIKQIRKQNQMCKFANDALDTATLLDSTLLFQSKLDKGIYNRLIEFFNLEPNFVEAQEVHSTWYNLHIKAENEWLALQSS
jgi:hypothetical protein